MKRFKKIMTIALATAIVATPIAGVLSANGIGVFDTLVAFATSSSVNTGTGTSVGGSGGGGSVSTESSQAAGNVSLAGNKVTTADGKEVSISTSPTSGATLTQLNDKATELLTNLRMAVADADGKVGAVIAAVNIKMDIPADTSVTVTFELKVLTPGNKVLALVMYEDGTTGFAYVETSFETGTVDVVLSGNVVSIVFVEYTPAPATRMSGLTAAQARQTFDAEYYASRYADVAAMYGNNPNRLFNHYLNFGLREGRAGNAEFDVDFYKLLYPDLQAVFGNDNSLYLRHYLNFGRSEGRLAGSRR